MTHKKKWLLLAPSGLLLIGAGACLVGWANTLKTRGGPPAKWIAAGTVALATLNAGVSVVGQSVIERVLHELREQPVAKQAAK
ncbi:hypothetical protein QMK33_08310 [Hymenobacter sp. H14-R3]|uniref:hypothetical protein n=1 Tax=Hymenobacter sp. H14-R3 TaxID=3046308 RepID=UPI0024BA44E4|nr:hypothetical protein [Hymenobacter sp. H14-R3]MDJ0365153.1 hypothetical protein [Hymenobacter sp. H14-R3]